MIKNNKGVTLVELLIVIVVMGIIAAFAIPAVGTIITNTEKDAIVADAIAVENAAGLYCAQNTCGDSITLTWADLSQYVSGISDTAYYEFTTGTPGTYDANVAVLSGGAWTVTLSALTSGDYEFLGFIPSTADRDDVTVNP